MGVTIHFEGKVKGATAHSLLIDELREFAASHDWKCEELAKSNAVLKRVRDEKTCDYSGTTFGVQLLPHPTCDPLRFEFDRDYYVQEFVKTQFAGVETHIALIELFRRESRPRRRAVLLRCGNRRGGFGFSRGGHYVWAQSFVA